MGRIQQVAVTAVLVGAATASAAPQGVPEVAGAGTRQVGGHHEAVLHSRVLDEDRTLWVRLPRGYETGHDRYPVLVVLDAEWHFNLVAADIELLSECSYLRPHPLPEMIVVGIVSQDRNRDFTPTHVDTSLGMSFPSSGGGPDFRRFLVDEVLPMIDSSYRTHPYRILAGWSLGGLCAVDTLLHEPSAFAAYVAVSPSLWWDDELLLTSWSAMAKTGRPKEPTDLLVTLGSTEQETSVARSTRAFLDHLAAHPVPNLRAELVPVEGLGHNLSPKMAYFLGLAKLFSDWNPPPEILDQGLSGLDRYFETLSTRYRFEIPVPETLYGTAGWKLFEAEQRTEAERIFRAWVERHPRSSVAMASLGALHRELGQLEDAAAWFRRAIEEESRGPEPRTSFLHGLQRDLAEVSSGS